MSNQIENVAEDKTLRQLLHEKIDQLGLGHLVALNRLVTQWEAEELRRSLDADFDQARQQGNLDPAKVSEAVALHRARQPYRR